jgi:hypothetical protein
MNKRRIILFAVLVGAALLALVASGQSHPDTGWTTVKATATISIDGKLLTSSAVWRVTYKNVWGIDTGATERITVQGDDILFDLGGGEHLFLHPDTYVINCAINFSAVPRDEQPGTLARFKGPCEDSREAGDFTLAVDQPGGPPSLADFGLNDGVVGSGVIGNAAAVFVLGRRGLALVSKRYVATNDPFRSDMILRFPWINQLPRICEGGLLHIFGGRSCTWKPGVIYQENFTSFLS